MMRKSLFFTLLLCCVSFHLMGQTDELVQFNAERLQVNKTGMIALGSWAVGNIAVNGWLTRNASGSDGHFYRMNIYWNIVNLALAVPGLRHSLITDPASLSLAETVSEYHNMKRIVLLNAGLDVAYITGGFLMQEMAKTRESRRNILKGYGRSLVLQGGFLLAFDVLLYLGLQQKSPMLNQILETVQLSPGGVGLTLRF